MQNLLLSLEMGTVERLNRELCSFSCSRISKVISVLCFEFTLGSTSSLRHATSMPFYTHSVYEVILDLHKSSKEMSPLSSLSFTLRHCGGGLELSKKGL